MTTFIVVPNWNDLTTINDWRRRLTVVIFLTAAFQRTLNTGNAFWQRLDFK
jgi:hypothetical protein